MQTTKFFLTLRASLADVMVRIYDEIEFLWSIKRINKILLALNEFDANQVITFFPTSRIRYLDLFPKEYFSKSLNFVRINPCVLRYIVKRLHRRAPIIVSSDLFLSCNSSFLVSLSKFKTSVFIWNDELEVETVLESQPSANIDFEGFFDFQLLLPSVPIKVPNFHAITSRQFSHDSSGGNNEKKVFFAGQVNSHFYENLIEKQNLSHVVNHARDFVFDRGGPFELFSDSQFWSSFEFSSLSEKVAVRHKVVNEWRQMILQSFVQDLGPKLYLMGSDFDSDAYKNATKVSQGANVLDEYKSSLINVDLGSQCGAAYLYPRTMEILSVNPASLASFERKPVNPSLEAPVRTWATVDDFFDLCRKKGIV